MAAIVTNNPDVAAEIGLQLLADSNRIQQLAHLLTAIDVGDRALKACEEFFREKGLDAGADAVAVNRADMDYLVKRAGFEIGGKRSSEL